MRWMGGAYFKGTWNRGSDHGEEKPGAIGLLHA